MAGAGTVSQLTCGVKRFRILGFLVWSRLVFACVTARTVRLKGGELPVDDFRIVLVALGAIEVVAMILRLIRESGVHVIGRYPRIRVVAQTTVLHGIEVAWVLPGGKGAIVAGGTGTQHLVVIDSCNRRPGRCAVAILANISCLDVGWSLANGIGAVVATHAVVHDVDVVEVGWQPGNRGMAVIAVIAAGDMGWVLTSRYDTVMARAACTDNLRVVDRVNRHPDV